MATIPKPRIRSKFPCRDGGGDTNCGDDDALGDADDDMGVAGGTGDLVEVSR